jgi:hypothetical protein
MEHLDEVPHHSQCMQFGNHPVVHSQESEETISFGDTAGTPIFFNHPMHDFNDDQSVKQSMRESWLLSYLCTLLKTVQTSKMLLQVPELAREEEFARCQELWQNQCHRGISTEKKRCTTWCHKPYANMTTIIYTTAILNFKIACVILLSFSQR